MDATHQGLSEGLPDRSEEVGSTAEKDGWAKRLCRRGRGNEGIRPHA